MAEASVSFAGTSPPPYAATPATHTDPSSPCGSASDETDITTERRSPGLPCAPCSASRIRPGATGSAR